MIRGPRPAGAATASALAGVLAAAASLAGCGGSARPLSRTARTGGASRLIAAPPVAVSPGVVPPLVNRRNVYAADRRGAFSPQVHGDRPLVYVPNSRADTVDEIDQRTGRIVRHFAVGGLPQHVVPAWDLKTLYVTNDTGNTLTPIDPRTGAPRATLAVEDPYNLYFSPDGRYALVMAERLRRIDFRNPRTMALVHSLQVPQCAGVNHADFTKDGRYMLASCEFGAAMVVVDLTTQRTVRTIPLAAGSSPQDVKLSPAGGVFYVADLAHAGLWTVSPRSWTVTGRIATGAGAHGLYPSRNAKLLYISNRSAGSISVLSFRTGRVVHTWRLPGGGSPDMGNVSADGRVLWLSGRYDGVVYAISTRTGRLLRKIPVGAGPHGLCVWPLPGRYSLGHTGILR